ncbi:winged helix-turn-helix domain-containing protein [Pseudoalteromonas sp. SCSIO 43101]|uniref:winged helix-turn-helix domain-containing protein n=1 Tax=Pseudoalteromonas sp. SCSIO 43101 TaxID=2822847 RepID=UPI00202B7BDE|nr:winged helix-turn-helix domain-containing protein [Pseudoalteromonas sp. SCSIO 43101]URQ88937.1 winged helix-turn-helix domain-containing protein [Pseudoalteromonas sp. SCSIO 43101]
MSVSELPNQFCINDFLIDVETGEVVSEGKVQVIEPKVMALLLVFAQRPRQVLSAEMLFEIVWPQAIYSPNSVRRNIALLRQALSDDNKSIIKTHPKRGYSLDAQIHFPDKKAITSSKELLHKKYLKQTLLLVPVLFVFILFFSFFSSSNDISLENLEPVTASNEKERFMQVSPDGRFVAYIQATNKPNKRKLLIKDLKLNAHWQLNTTLKAFTYLAWDKNTNALVYSFKGEEGISFNRLLLNEQAKVVNEEKLFSRSDITWNSLFFIDDQQNLYYLANRNSSEHSRNVSLYRHNLITGNYEKLLQPSDDFKPYKLALSPDQKQLALVGFNENAISEVKLLNLASSELTSVGKIDHNWHFMDWFEDGDSLLLSNGSELKQLKLSGELTTLNFKSYNFLVYPQIVKDKLYFIEAKSDQDTLISSLDLLPTPTKIINSNTIDKGAALSPDEKHIAYMSMKHGLPQLFLKNIENEKETLLFENTKQEFALSKPIWDISGTRIASSINNKPFIIEFEQNQFSVRWLNEIIGEPIAWYKKSDAILFVDKKTHNDEIVRFNLTTNQIVSLNTQLTYKEVFLNDKDELLSFHNGRVISNGDTNLLNNKHFILSVYPQENGFFYQYTQNQTPTMNFYDYKQGVQNLSKDFQQFCVVFCSQITALNGNTILLKEQHDTADILVLKIALK